MPAAFSCPWCPWPRRAALALVPLAALPLPVSSTHSRCGCCCCCCWPCCRRRLLALLPPLLALLLLPSPSLFLPPACFDSDWPMSCSRPPSRSGRDDDPSHKRPPWLCGRSASVQHQPTPKPRTQSRAAGFQIDRSTPPSDGYYSARCRRDFKLQAPTRLKGAPLPWLRLTHSASHLHTGMHRTAVVLRRALGMGSTAAGAARCSSSSSASSATATATTTTTVPPPPRSGVPPPSSSRRSLLVAAAAAAATTTTAAMLCAAHAAAAQPVAHMSSSSSSSLSSSSRVPATADLCDEHEPGDTLQVADPTVAFKAFGGLARFGGEIRTVKCFENNPLCVRGAIGNWGADGWLWLSICMDRHHPSSFRLLSHPSIASIHPQFHTSS